MPIIYFVILILQHDSEFTKYKLHRVKMNPIVSHSIQALDHMPDKSYK